MVRRTVMLAELERTLTQYGYSVADAIPDVFQNLLSPRLFLCFFNSQKYG